MQYLQYPIGKVSRPHSYMPADVRAQIASIADFPSQLIPVADSLTIEELNTPYRPGGWTAAQVIHHLYDSHSNAYTRFKLTLTEEHPSIKPYDEAAWAELTDGRDTDIHHSLSLIKHLHARWATLLFSITDEQWLRKLHHPEHKRDMPLFELAAIYSWHGMHHLAHIKLIKNGEHSSLAP